MAKILSRQEGTNVVGLYIRFHEVGASFTGHLLSAPTERVRRGIDGNEMYWDEAKTQPVKEYVYDFYGISRTECSSSCHYCRKRTSVDDPANRLWRLTASSKQNLVIQRAVWAIQNPTTYGLLTLTYSADDKERQQKGQDAPKIFVATYRNPTSEEEKMCDEFLGISTEPDVTYDDLFDSRWDDAT